MAGFFRGTSHDQDTRWQNKHDQLLKTKKFDPVLNTKVDMKKVKLEVIKPWIVNKVTEVLGFEDEVVISLCINLLEEGNVDPKNLQIQLTGFLERKAGEFVTELWKKLVSASSNSSGIPLEMLEEKKRELLNRKLEEERLNEEVRRKREQLDRSHKALYGDDGAASGDKPTKKSRFSSAPADQEQSASGSAVAASSSSDSRRSRSRSRSGRRSTRDRSSRSPGKSRSRSRSRKAKRRGDSRSRSRSRSRSGKRDRKDKKHKKKSRSRSRSQSPGDEDREKLLRDRALKSLQA